MGIGILAAGGFLVGRATLRALRSARRRGGARRALPHRCSSWPGSAPRWPLDRGCWRSAPCSWPCSPASGSSAGRPDPPGLGSGLPRAVPMTTGALRGTNRPPATVSLRYHRPGTPAAVPEVPDALLHVDRARRGRPRFALCAVRARSRPGGGAVSPRGPARADARDAVRRPGRARRSRGRRLDGGHRRVSRVGIAPPRRRGPPAGHARRRLPPAGSRCLPWAAPQEDR